MTRMQMNYIEGPAAIADNLDADLSARKAGCLKIVVSGTALNGGYETGWFPVGDKWFLC